MNDLPQKVAFIVGAGATVSDVYRRSSRQRPPLDKGFFGVSVKTDPGNTTRIQSYVEEVYDKNIYHIQNDSLEAVMAIVYADIFDPKLKSRAATVFRLLVRLFNRRLADTTNRISATQQRFLYRILSLYLQRGIMPENIVIVTFNQDIQIEKILHRLQQTAKYERFGTIFNFPFCYYWPDASTSITSPGRGDLFEEGNLGLGGTTVLKLHGSLNWYSTHKSTKVKPQWMFRSNRTIHITRRQTIDPEMKLHARRRMPTLPVIVPPVTHKSSILHNSLKPVWSRAETELKQADEVVIFGYSCPTMDFESSNLIQRSLKANRKYRSLSIIDPDPGVLSRYAELVNPHELHYYPYAENFLEKRRK